jgi:hypothetical protein
MEIGPPKRVIEVDPVSIPVPETFPDIDHPTPVPDAEPAEAPRREPEREPEPASRGR